MRDLKNTIQGMTDEQERAEMQQFARILILAVFGLICLYMGLKVGLSEGMGANLHQVSEAPQGGLTAEARREVVSRWYQ